MSLTCDTEIPDLEFSRSEALFLLKSNEKSESELLTFFTYKLVGNVEVYSWDYSKIHMDRSISVRELKKAA